jgi:hypothetical protein
MGQFSLPWPMTEDEYGGGVIGDGRRHTDAEFAEFLYSLFGDGVLTGGNALAVTSPGANQISVNTGHAMVRGRWFKNDTALALTPSSAGAGTTRQDSVVVEVDWTGTGETEQYTVRAIIKNGTAGAPPAMTQNPGALWQMRLYDYTIDDSGAVSAITDRRSYCHYSTEIITAMCAAGLLSADVAGRALMANGFFDAATIMAKFGAGSITNAALVHLLQAGAFQADTASRALFANGFVTSSMIAPGVIPEASVPHHIGDIKWNATATLGGPDGRRMVVNGTTYESWVHCDGGVAVNGVTIPDLRNRVLAGVSSTHPAGTMAGAETADLTHAHSRGSLQMNPHGHAGGDLYWDHYHILPMGTNITNSSPNGDLGAGTGSFIGTGSWSGQTASAAPTIIGTTDDGGNATQDMRQPTYYMRAYIFVG